jgi:hypothetical protein
MGNNVQKFRHYPVTEKITSLMDIPDSGGQFIQITAFEKVAAYTAGKVSEYAFFILGMGIDDYGGIGRTAPYDGKYGRFINKLIFQIHDDDFRLPVCKNNGIIGIGSGGAYLDIFLSLEERNDSIPVFFAAVNNGYSYHRCIKYYACLVRYI